jgi:hypothetical protein
MKLRLLGVAFVLVSLCAMNNKADAAQDCPTKHFNGSCIQVITYATNPNTGTCCVYANPCIVPDGWATSTSGCPVAG